MNESTETSMDAVEPNTSITSAEDKFFGVKTKIVKKSKEKEALSESESDDFDLEIVDDKPPVNKAAYEPTGDEELDSYSASVRKRLDKATFKRREAERLAELRLSLRCKRQSVMKEVFLHRQLNSNKRLINNN